MKIPVTGATGRIGANLVMRRGERTDVGPGGIVYGTV